MLNSILIIMKVEASIFINGFLYFLKKLFFLKKALSSTNYSFLRIKSGLGYFALIYQFVWSAIKAFIIPLIFIVLPPFLFSSLGPGSPLTLVFVFYFVLRLLSSSLLELNYQKFIMIKELRMNPRKYSHAYLLKKEGFKFTGRTIAFLLLGGFIGMPPAMALLFSTLATMTAVIAEAVHLYVFKKNGFILEEHNIALIILYLLVFAAAYGIYFLLPELLLGRMITQPMFIALVALMSIPALRYLIHYDAYPEALLRVTSLEKMNKVQTAVSEARFADVKMSDKDFGNTYIDNSRHQNKEGFAYLNALFFERHRKFFRKPIIIKTGIVAAVFTALIGAGLVLDNNLLVEVSEGLGTQYYIFIFAMYMLCNSSRETKAMFYNCDLSMLKYGFYRQPKALLEMFSLRLKRIVLGNMIPTSAVIAGLLLVSTISGVRNYQEMMPVLIMIVALSLFFSIHYIFMYYIFQPYTSSMKVKNPIFNIINGSVYMISYLALQIRTPVSNFLPMIISFSIIYAITAVILVYKKAPQTFRVK